MQPGDGSPGVRVDGRDCEVVGRGLLKIDAAPVRRELIQRLNIRHSTFDWWA